MQKRAMGLFSRKFQATEHKLQQEEEEEGILQCHKGINQADTRKEFRVLWHGKGDNWKDNIALIYRNRAIKNKSTKERGIVSYAIH